MKTVPRFSTSSNRPSLVASVFWPLWSSFVASVFRPPSWDETVPSFPIKISTSLLVASVFWPLRLLNVLFFFSQGFRMSSSSVRVPNVVLYSALLMAWQSYSEPAVAISWAKVEVPWSLRWIPTFFPPVTKKSVQFSFCTKKNFLKLELSLFRITSVLLVEE